MINIRIFYIYLLFMNILSFILMYLDKYKARKGQWRISEKTLFTFAFLGGSIGSILGMYAFRHKTKHFKFKLGMPAILIFQVLIIYLAITKGIM